MQKFKKMNAEKEIARKTRPLQSDEVSRFSDLQEQGGSRKEELRCARHSRQH
jgi:hypothetical protein